MNRYITVTALLLALGSSAPGQGPGEANPLPPQMGDPIDPETLKPFAELYDVEWTIDAKGRTWMTPSPSLGMINAKEPLFFDRELARQWGRQDADPFPFVTEGLRNGGVSTWLNIVAFGRHDLVSLTEAEHHYRRLRMPLDDDALIARIQSSVPADDLSQPVAHRAALDRILAMRIAAARGLKRALPDLVGISAAPENAMILRYAAADAASAIDPVTGGANSLAPDAPLPPLDGALAKMPSNSDFIGVTYGDRLPDVRGFSSRQRALSQESIRQDILMAGGSCSPSTLAGAMKVTGVASELPYEAARVFGNMRIRRVVGGTSRGTADAMIIADGLFDAERLASAFAEDADELQRNEDGSYRCALENGELHVSPTRLVLRVGQFEPIGDDLGAQLGELRPSEEDAMWSWIANPKAMAPELPILAEINTPAIASIAFGETTELRVRAGYTSPGAAEVACNGIRSLPGVALAGMPDREMAEMLREWLRTLDVEAEGETVTVSLSLPTVREIMDTAMAVQEEQLRGR